MALERVRRATGSCAAGGGGATTSRGGVCSSTLGAGGGGSSFTLGGGGASTGARERVRRATGSHVGGGGSWPARGVGSCTLGDGGAVAGTRGSILGDGAAGGTQQSTGGGWVGFRRWERRTRGARGGGVPRVWRGGGLGPKRLKAVRRRSIASICACTVEGEAPVSASVSRCIPRRRRSAGVTSGCVTPGGGTPACP